MTITFNTGVRYRMPVSFGPAPGPRQKADGTVWRAEETGMMRMTWLRVAFRTDPAALEPWLPDGFTLRLPAEIGISCAWLEQVYWLAGRSYGIVVVDIPAEYQGRDEKLAGSFCPVLWEGLPDAVLTGREELGFPKLYAEVPRLSFDRTLGTAGCAIGWDGFTFLEVSASALVAAGDAPGLPGSSGPQMYYKYVPRTAPFGRGGADCAYVTTNAPLPGAASAAVAGMVTRRYRGAGTCRFRPASFAELPTLHGIVNGFANLPVWGFGPAELIEASGPGIVMSMDALRAVAPPVSTG